MLKVLKKDDFIKNNIILFVDSMVVAILNYLYHPTPERMIKL